MKFFRTIYLYAFSLIVAGNAYAGLGVMAEGFYWYTNETMDWAFTLKNEQNLTKTEYKTFVFDWAPGFRVGLSYTMNHDHWDTRAYYTWFMSKAEGSTSGPVTPAFLAARLSLLEPFSSGKASLHLDYDILDWDLGRYFSRNSLALRPFIGLKGGWITQKIKSSWTTPDFLGFLFVSATENLKQSFKGVGPKGGVLGKWFLGNRGFNLMGQLDAGYLWGHWSIQDKYTDNFNTKISVITNDRDFGALVLHIFFGLGWEHYFKEERYHLGLKFGYEMENWFNHCQFFTDASGSQTNDLILQGLNFGINFDF